MIKVLEKMVRVLDLVSSLPRADLKTLARETGLKKPGLFRLLGSLVELRLLRRKPDGSYEIGPRLRELAQPFLSEQALVRAARLEAQSLAERTGEQVTVARLAEGERVILASATCERQMVVVSNEREAHLPMDETATGLVLLASLDPKARGAVVPESERKPDNARLEAIADAGWACVTTADRQAAFLAVPVKGADGQTCAALGMSIPTSRLDTARERELVANMQNAAARISAAAARQDQE